MISFFKKYIEPKTWLRNLEIGLIVFLCIVSMISLGYGLIKINSNVSNVQFIQTVEMYRDIENEDFSEDYTVCDVTYTNGEKEMVVSYSYEDYVKLEETSIIAYEFESEDKTKLYFDHKDVEEDIIKYSYRQVKANELTQLFNLGMASFILMISIAIMTLFAKVFTTYEKSWFVSIMVLATIISVLFPEESANGVNGIVIMLLYLLDTFLNILCELLISKQSRYNFLVSVLVEIVEIAMCVVLMYRFATMVTTLFFWLPIDIISFINWSKHKDEEESELTVVRKLKGYQKVLVLVGIVVWTLVVGYFISGLDIATDFYQNASLATAIIYIDACASAVGVANGIFIYFRLQEQWIAWYICSFLEAIINIVSGQYVLLVLKLGYFTNTTYGYIKWNSYIRTHSSEKPQQIA